MKFDREYDLREIKNLLDNYSRITGDEVGANRVLMTAQEKTGVSASDLFRFLKQAKNIEGYLFLPELSYLIEYSEKKYNYVVNYQDLFVLEILQRGLSAGKTMLSIDKEFFQDKLYSLSYNLRLKNKLDLALVNVMNVKRYRELNDYENTQVQAVLEKCQIIDEEMPSKISELVLNYSIVQERAEIESECVYNVGEIIDKDVKPKLYLLSHLCYFGSYNNVLKCLEFDWGLEDEHATRLASLLIDECDKLDSIVLCGNENKCVKVCLEMNKEKETQEPSDDSDWGI